MGIKDIKQSVGKASIESLSLLCNTKVTCDLPEEEENRDCEKLLESAILNRDVQDLPRKHGKSDCFSVKWTAEVTVSSDTVILRFHRPILSHLQQSYKIFPSASTE
jgi:hypothetical protein